MSNSDKDQGMALLKKWADYHRALTIMMDGIEKSIGLDMDGPMPKAVWGLFQSYTESIAEQLGDLGGWMEWYWCENKMGKNRFPAGYDKNPIQVRTLCNLYNLIKQSQEMGGK